MTIQEFYEWAVAHDYEHFQLQAETSCGPDDVVESEIFVLEHFQTVIV